MTDSISLADAIKVVRAELEKAADPAHVNKVAFRYTSIEIELELELTREAEGRVGARIWLASAEAAGRRARAETQRVKVVLEPFDRSTGFSWANPSSIPHPSTMPDEI